MYFVRSSKRKGVDDYDLYYFKEKGSINSKAPKESDASLSNDSVGFKIKV